jgi:hypothetical protein
MTVIDGDDYYEEKEVNELVDDMDELHEYLHGWYDAILIGAYKKKYVDMFLNR